MFLNNNRRNFKFLFGFSKNLEENFLFARKGELLNVLENILTYNGSMVSLKSGVSTRADKVTIEGQEWFLKSYRISSFWKKILFPFRCPLPLKAALNAYQISQAGFNVILPVAGWLTSAHFPSGIYGGLLFPYVKDFEKLPDIWKRALGDRRLMESLISSIFTLFCRLHEAGIYIRDTKANNFLVLPGKEPVLFDLDVVRFFKGSVPHRLQRKNYLVLKRTLVRKGIPDRWLEEWFKR